MAKFKYVGDRASTKVFGKTFVQGDPTEVTDEAEVKRLEGNSHFERAQGTPGRPPKSKSVSEDAAGGDEG